MAKGNVLVARIIRVSGKYGLEIENMSDEIVTDIEISTAGFKYLDQPAMQLRFNKGLTLQHKSKGVIQHEVLVDSDGKWMQSPWHDGDMLKYFPEAGLRDSLDVHYLVNGKNFFSNTST